MDHFHQHFFESAFDVGVGPWSEVPFTVMMHIRICSRINAFWYMHVFVHVQKCIKPNTVQRPSIHSIASYIVLWKKLWLCLSGNYLQFFRNRPFDDRSWTFNAQYLNVRNYYFGGVVVFMVDWDKVVALLEIVWVLVALPYSKRC